MNQKLRLPVFLQRVFNKGLHRNFRDLNFFFPGSRRDAGPVATVGNASFFSSRAGNFNPGHLILFALFLLLFSFGLLPLQAQINPAGVQLRVKTPGHAWRPPFGTERVGRSAGVTVSFESKNIPAEAYHLVGYSGGKEVFRQVISLVFRPPVSGRTSKAAVADRDSFYIVSQPEAKGLVFWGRPFLPDDLDELALFFLGKSINTVELDRLKIQLKHFEAEVRARPDEVINPVDLGAILVPADWLRLAGGQKAFVTVAA